MIGWAGSGLATQPVGGDGQAAGKLGWQRTDCEFEMQPAKLKCSLANCNAHGRMKMQSGLHEAPKIAFSPALMYLDEVDSHLLLSLAGSVRCDTAPTLVKHSCI